MYLVISRKDASAHARGDQGVRALRVAGDWVRLKEDALAHAEKLYASGLNVWVVQVVADIGEMHDEGGER